MDTSLSITLLQSTLSNLEKAFPRSPPLLTCFLTKEDFALNHETEKKCSSLLNQGLNSKNAKIYLSIFVKLFELAHPFSH